MGGGGFCERHRIMANGKLHRHLYQHILVRCHVVLPELPRFGNSFVTLIISLNQSSPKSANLINQSPVVDHFSPPIIHHLALIGGSSVAALEAVLFLVDPERRGQMQAEEVGGGYKEVVKEYFNNNGFQRWRRIYGEMDDVNKVQLDIRIGHSKTVENLWDREFVDFPGKEGCTGDG
ncbi:Magnesium-protoporphyrin IX methyltransferase C-terminaldomain-containing protein [Forsythia ovata]|uniref:Magnesium-protoporphyrin IX methyltransferase C-terminaldomain-containing protein n=1 Tax=Forsythia ovata TaxID=205694 RepID=A0ABD1U9P8_9LAMI